MYSKASVMKWYFWRIISCSIPYSLSWVQSDKPKHCTGWIRLTAGLTEYAFSATFLIYNACSVSALFQALTLHFFVLINIGPGVGGGRKRRGKKGNLPNTLDDDCRSTVFTFIYLFQSMLLITSRGIPPWDALKSPLMRKWSVELWWSF